ncbi:MAG: hypothetical protein HC772_01560 [Leptolyngbyaceae cyanobacterium CRU_2_3]|nr:hypothetical protein [Leptolyngbyaceae cyanobacterium CRU_2_3]
MRREVFLKVGKLDTQMPFSADWMLYSKMMMISSIAFVAEPLNYHRTHEKTMRKSNNDGLFLEERIQVLDYLFQRVQAPENFLEKIYDPTLGWWMRVLICRKAQLSGHQRIYRLLADIEPSINYRIAKNCIDALGRKLRLR